MRELTIERRLIRAVVSRGGLCPKFTSPGEDGWPDRIILYEGKVWFVETKAPLGRLAPIQKVQHKLIRSRGLPVFVPFNQDQVDSIIQEIFDAKRIQTA